MRITRSLTLRAHLLARASFKRIGFTSGIAIFVIASAITGQNLLTHPSTAYAATTSEACFQFNSASGTITNYYDNENNNSSNPVCPRDVEIPQQIGGVNVTSIGSNAGGANTSFYGKQLTSLTFALPSNVTSIGDYAFQWNQLTTLVIPDSVTTTGTNAFSYNKLTSVIIPDSVTSLGDGAFYINQLTTLPSYFSNPAVTTIPNGIFSSNKFTSLTIPDNITSIGQYAFYANQLTSLTLGDTLASIGPLAFYANKLNQVTIPNSVTSIDQDAFFGQNPVGGDMDLDSSCPTFIWSSDPTIVQAAYDSIWYVWLITEDPSNPNNLHSSYINEDYWQGWDANANSQNDSLGGHIINAVPAVLSFKDAHGTSLQPDQTLTGKLSDGTVMSDYLVKNGPVMPAVADVTNPTPAEQTAINQAFSAYYHIGDSFSYTAPVINDITPTPASYSFVLGASTVNNTKTFVYASAAPSSGGQLANTGANVEFVMVGAGLCVIVSVFMIIKRMLRVRYN